MKSPFLMKSPFFWSVYCLVVVIASLLFSSLTFAQSRKSHSEPKNMTKKNKTKTLWSATKPTPIIKIGGASYVLVRIGKPYIYEMKSDELRGKAKK